MNKSKMSVKTWLQAEKGDLRIYYNTGESINQQPLDRLLIVIIENFSDFKFIACGLNKQTLVRDMSFRLKKQRRPNGRMGNR
jgi:hypothetical protein